MNRIRRAKIRDGIHDLLTDIAAGDVRPTRFELEALVALCRDFWLHNEATEFELHIADLDRSRRDGHA